MIIVKFDLNQAIIHDLVLYEIQLFYWHFTFAIETNFKDKSELIVFNFIWKWYGGCTTLTYVWDSLSINNHCAQTIKLENKSSKFRYYYDVLWNHHCSCGTNVRAFGW